MKERPILFSVTTGEPSKRGKRLRSNDGLTWKQRNREAVNARRRELYAAEPDKHRERQRAYKTGESKPKVLAFNREWSAGYRTLTLAAEFFEEESFEIQPGHLNAFVGKMLRHMAENPGNLRANNRERKNG